jgi:hypothetical protein
MFLHNPLESSNHTYVLTFVMDEVEVCTGSVECFCIKMHKTAANFSVLRNPVKNLTEKCTLYELESSVLDITR